jgi:hypothetical protein
MTTRLAKSMASGTGSVESSVSGVHDGIGVLAAQRLPHLVDDRCECAVVRRLVEQRGVERDRVGSPDTAVVVAVGLPIGVVVLAAFPREDG